MSDEDLVTLRVKHTLDGVIFEGSMSRQKAFWKSARFTRSNCTPLFADIGGHMLQAHDGPLTFTISSEVD